jgi:mRNA interferase HigB
MGGCCVGANRPGPALGRSHLFAKCLHARSRFANIELLNVISKPGLLDLLSGKSADMQKEVLAWYYTAKNADWSELAEVRAQFPDADFVNGLPVFNIRHNRFRLIVLPVFSRRKLYIKALLNHKEYTRKDWKTKWL